MQREAMESWKQLREQQKNCYASLKTRFRESEYTPHRSLRITIFRQLVQQPRREAKRVRSPLC